MDYCIVDLGIGIRERILRDKQESLAPVDAITWAVSGNTSRTGNRPGGLGFRLLREFIKLNKGRFIVVSDAGFWAQMGQKVFSKSFKSKFQGTVVTLEIDTADTASYRLKSEICTDSIF